MLSLEPTDGIFSAKKQKRFLASQHTLTPHSSDGQPSDGDNAEHTCRFNHYHREITWASCRHSSKHARRHSQSHSCHDIQNKIKIKNQNQNDDVHVPRR